MVKAFVYNIVAFKAVGYKERIQPSLLKEKYNYIWVVCGKRKKKENEWDLRVKIIKAYYSFRSRVGKL